MIRIKALLESGVSIAPVLLKGLYSRMPYEVQLLLHGSLDCDNRRRLRHILSA